jgi:CubicO group peptidase (beta-lactamase class C family)
MSIPHAAGSLYSTTEDLLRWEQGLFGGKVLSPASFAKMTTPYQGNYGMGLFIRTTNGHKTISHSGGIEGFTAYLMYYPEDKMTVAVLSNFGLGATGKIANQLGAIGHNETLETKP